MLQYWRCISLVYTTRHVPGEQFVGRVDRNGCIQAVDDSAELQDGIVSGDGRTIAWSGDIRWHRVDSECGMSRTMCVWRSVASFCTALGNMYPRCRRLLRLHLPILVFYIVDSILWKRFPIVAFSIQAFMSCIAGFAIGVLSSGGRAPAVVRNFYMVCFFGLSMVQSYMMITGRCAIFRPTSTFTKMGDTNFEYLNEVDLDVVQALGVICMVLNVSVLIYACWQFVLWRRARLEDPMTWGNFVIRADDALRNRITQQFQIHGNDLEVQNVFEVTSPSLQHKFTGSESQAAESVECAFSDEQRILLMKLCLCLDDLLPHLQALEFAEVIHVDEALGSLKAQLVDIMGQSVDLVVKWPWQANMFDLLEEVRHAFGQALADEFCAGRVTIRHLDALRDAAVAGDWSARLTGILRGAGLEWLLVPSLPELKALVSARLTQAEVIRGTSVVDMSGNDVKGWTLSDEPGRGLGPERFPLHAALFRPDDRPPRMETRLLYHGAPSRSLKSIVRGGFRVPGVLHWKPLMFGSGIYFADVPQKSWMFSADKRYLLMCDVALGRVREMKSASPNFNLHALRQSLTGVSYDSLVGLKRSEGGTLPSREYIVYRSEQTLPRYLLEVRAR